MTCKAIDKAFVRDWAGRYPPDADDHVLRTVHPAVKRDGYFTLDHAIDVIKWKSNRSVTFLRRNEADDVESITKMALGAPEHLRHRVLRLLHGVGTPVASALLTIHDPTNFTVIDVLALRALRHHCEGFAGSIRYTEYLGLCRRIAERCDTDLRTLDRALWSWGKAHPE